MSHLPPQFTPGQPVTAPGPLPWDLRPPPPRIPLGGDPVAQPVSCMPPPSLTARQLRRWRAEQRQRQRQARAAEQAARQEREVAAEQARQRRLRKLHRSPTTGRRVTSGLPLAVRRPYDVPCCICAAKVGARCTRTLRTGAVRTVRAHLERRMASVTGRTDLAPAQLRRLAHDRKHTLPPGCG